MLDKNEFVEINSLKFTHGEIHRVVDKFYAKVALDPYLRAPFSVVDDWPHHIQRLTHFWWMRLGGKPYMSAQYNPIQKHFESGFSEEFLDIWLTLFKKILRENLAPEQAQLWGELTESMGVALNRNNELMKQHYLRTI